MYGRVHRQLSQILYSGNGVFILLIRSQYGIFFRQQKGCNIAYIYAALRIRIQIRICRIRMFLGLLDPDPDPLVGGMDPDPDPSITKQK
jgi:hypothetical protein